MSCSTYMLLSCGYRSHNNRPRSPMVLRPLMYTCLRVPLLICLQTFYMTLGVPRIMKVEMSWVEEVVPFFQQLTWMVSLLALDFGVAALDLGFLVLGQGLIFAYAATLPLLLVLAFAATELLLLMEVRCLACVDRWKRNLTRFCRAFRRVCHHLTVIVWCPMLHQRAPIHAGVGHGWQLTWCEARQFMYWSTC